MDKVVTAQEAFDISRDAFIKSVNDEIKDAMIEGSFYIRITDVDPDHKFVENLVGSHFGCEYKYEWDDNTLILSWRHLINKKVWCHPILDEKAWMIKNCGCPDKEYFDKQHK